MQKKKRKLLHPDCHPSHPCFTKVGKDGGNSSQEGGSRNQSLVCTLTIAIMIIINLIYIAQFDSKGNLTALHIVIKHIQTQYMHIWTYIKQSYSCTYTCLRIYTYTSTCTNIFVYTYEQDCPCSYNKLTHTLTPTCVLRRICPCIIYIHTNTCAHVHIPIWIYMHIWTYIKQSYSCTYTCLRIYTYTSTCTNIFVYTYEQDCPCSYNKLTHTLTPTCVLRRICPCIIYIHTNTCAHMHIPICTGNCIYIYTQTEKQNTHKTHYLQGFQPSDGVEMTVYEAVLDPWEQYTD